MKGVFLMPLTTKELAMLEDQLTKEQNLIKKYNMYASMATDQQIKAQFQNNATKHQNHYNSLLSQLS